MILRILHGISDRWLREAFTEGELDPNTDYQRQHWELEGGNRDLRIYWLRLQRMERNERFRLFNHRSITRTKNSRMKWQFCQNYHRAKTPAVPSQELRVSELLTSYFSVQTRKIRKCLKFGKKNTTLSSCLENVFPFQWFHGFLWNKNNARECEIITES